MKRLSSEQERRLLRKYTIGDFGPGKWSTIQSLITEGMIAVQGKDLVVTEKGKQYCDMYHTEMPL
jgi:hypothetical protein